MHIILVHGAFHEGGCWELLIPHLEARNFTVHSPTLRGHGSRPRFGYRVSMSTYAEDVLEVAERIGEPSLLLGHSMGGFSITAAAERRPQLFRGLIYLTAMVPTEKPAPMIGAQAVSAPFQSDEEKRLLKDGFKASLLRGAFSMKAETARQLVFNACTAEVQDIGLTHVCPQPLRPSFSRVGWTAAGVGSLPKFYVECSRDRLIPLAGQRALQQRMRFDGVVTLDSDHSPALCVPEQVAATIEQFAQNPLIAGKK